VEFVGLCTFSMYVDIISVAFSEVALTDVSTPYSACMVLSKT